MKAFRLVLVGALGAMSFLGTSSAAHAGECYDADYNTYECDDPIISRVTAPAVTVQSTSNPVLVPVTVVVTDPDDTVDAVDFVLTQGATQVDFDYASAPISTTATTKTFRGTFTHYDWDGWGQFRVTVQATSWSAEVTEPVASVLTSIKSKSVATNVPSLTTINKGQQFTVRGTLKRFNGDALSGQRVSIYYVPAGQTKSSFAGYATTTSSGSLSLGVRAWYTGSWFVSYPGSTHTTDTYKGAWVRVR